MQPGCSHRSAGTDPQSYDAEAGYPGLKMAGPWSPCRLNLTGMVEPALAALIPPLLFRGGPNPSKAQTTLTVAVSVPVAPSGSLTWTLNVRVAGAWIPAAEKTNEAPGFSNVPLPSRSHA